MSDSHHVQYGKEMRSNEGKASSNVSLQNINFTAGNNRHQKSHKHGGWTETIINEKAGGDKQEIYKQLPNGMQGQGHSAPKTMSAKTARQLSDVRSLTPVQTAAPIGSSLVAAALSPRRNVTLDIDRPQETSASDDKSQQQDASSKQNHSNNINNASASEAKRPGGASRVLAPGGNMKEASGAGNNTKVPSTVAPRNDTGSAPNKLTREPTNASSSDIQIEDVTHDDDGAAKDVTRAPVQVGNVGGQGNLVYSGPSCEQIIFIHSYPTRAKLKLCSSEQQRVVVVFKGTTQWQFEPVVEHVAKAKA